MAASFSLLVAVAGRFPVLFMAIGVALLGVVLARIRPLDLLKRLVPLNLFMLLLFVLLPLTTDGSPRFVLGPLALSTRGLLLTVAIALKGNAIVLALVVLLGTMDVTTLGHALSHLRVPDKLSHLLLFTVRYIDVLDRERLRLLRAMKVRAFRPGMNRHTYRSYGHLVGMLLVSSFDRSERIVAAMKCRGFRGRFYLLDHFAFSSGDARFAAASVAILLALALAEWS